MIRVVTLVLAVVGLIASGATSQAAAQIGPDETAPAFHGSLPTGGGMVLVASAPQMTVEGFVRALTEGGCGVEVLAITRGGSFQLYAPGAPAFANARFVANFEPGSLALVRCARPAVPDEHLLRPVTKDQPLPANFVPDSLTLLSADLVIPGVGELYLTEETAEAVTQLIEGAGAAGHEIAVRSAYRSYQEQVFTYQYWVSVLGVEEANRRSARPGHSEHQLGTAVDVTSASVGWDLDPRFGDTAEGRWLKQHAWRFGFVESYPEDAEAITGYRYEPWHLRYIGETHAGWVRQTGLTLTEYLARIEAGAR